MKFGGSSVRDPEKSATSPAGSSPHGNAASGSSAPSRRWGGRRMPCWSSRARCPRPRPARARHAALDRRTDRVRARRHGRARPRPRGGLVHGLAGGDHHRRRLHEGQDPRDHARARPRARSTREDRPRRRLPGLLTRHDGRDDARPRRDGRDRGRPRGRARRLVRDLLRVLGVFTADPRIVPEARKLHSVSYEEMLEMAASGAKVLMLRAVELARAHGVPSTRARRSRTSPEPGSRRSTSWSSRSSRRSRTRRTRSCSRCAAFPTAGLGRHGPRGGRGGARQRRHDPPERRARRRRALVLGAARRSARPRAGARRGAGGARADEIDEIEDLGKVSLDRRGNALAPGVAAKMFRTLASEGINLRMISTSPIKISCLIARTDVERAVRSLHAVFALENEALSVGSE